jgi:uncharacterized SAM-binding protein YcdF (DUF218 family)
VLALVLLLGTAACAVVGVRLFTSPPAPRSARVAALVAFAVSISCFCYAAGAYELRKLVGACLMPAGLVWFALTAFAWAVGRRGQRRLTVAGWCLWLAYTAAGNVWVGHGLVAWLERDYSAIDPLSQPPFDAVLVLGGGISIHDSGQLYVGDSGDRVVLAARLYRAGVAPTLVTSGPPWPPGRSESSIPRLTAQLWSELGVDRADIILMEGPWSTSEEISDFADLARSRGWQRIGLITSASHMWRATRLCDRHGLGVFPLPADFRSTTYPPRPVNLVPQGGAFANAHRACWEILGAAVGR